METTKLNILEKLDSVLRERKSQERTNSYLSGLYSKGNTHINSKILEECNEYIESTCGSDREHKIHEAADLWFHTMVMLSHLGLEPNKVLEELEKRFNISGLDEKASRHS